MDLLTSEVGLCVQTVGYVCLGASTFFATVYLIGEIYQISTAMWHAKRGKTWYSELLDYFTNPYEVADVRGAPTQRRPDPAAPRSSGAPTQRRPDPASSSQHPVAWP